MTIFHCILSPSLHQGYMAFLSFLLLGHGLPDGRPRCFTKDFKRLFSQPELQKQEHLRPERVTRGSAITYFRLCRFLLRTFVSFLITKASISSSPGYICLKVWSWNC